MNPEVKASWVAALRSGRYEQGEGALNRGGKFCCLGVLAELAVEAGLLSHIQPPIDRPDTISIRYSVEPSGSWYSAEGSGLPQGLRRWSGLMRDVEAVLVGLNDNDHESFARIADYIEENL